MEWVDFPAHKVRLATQRLVLRPFERVDFSVALPFYRDPEFLQAMEGDPDVEVSLAFLEQVGLIMAGQGFLFAVETKEEGQTIGEACLQWMNLDRAQVLPGEKVMRLPMGIWDKGLWGKGYGREIVECLMEYGFNTLKIDRFCAMDIKQNNYRSQALFSACGLQVARRLAVEQVVDMELGRESYFSGGRALGAVQ